MIPLDVNIERYLDLNVVGTPSTDRLGRVEHPRDVSRLSIRAYRPASDETVHLTGDVSDVEIRLLPAEPEERALGKLIEDVVAGNRWAAFTDAELGFIAAGGFPHGIDDGAPQWQHELGREAEGELERRLST